MKHIDLMLCVNDPDNGVDTGRVDGIDVAFVGNPESLLELRGQPLVCRTIQGADGRPHILRVGRVNAAIITYQGWVGNWCWDMARVNLEDALRVINYVQRRGWQCEMGEITLYDAFAAGVGITGEMLQRVYNEAMNESRI